LKKFKDIVELGTDSDVAGNLIKCSTQLRLQSAAIPISVDDDFVGLVAQRILLYVSTEAEAASALLHKDIKLFAWRTRNIFEGFLLLKFTLSSQKNAEVFCAQRISDEKMILEGLLSFFPELSGDDVTFLKDRVAKCKAVLQKYNFEKVSPWRIDKLAENVGMKDDYAAFYKLYSKYVHPSSWIIMTDADEYDNHHYWEVFILNAQLYSNYCCGAAEEFLASRGSCLE
jgi:hypothetical protein